MMRFYVLIYAGPEKTHGHRERFDVKDEETAMKLAQRKWRNRSKDGKVKGVLCERHIYARNTIWVEPLYVGGEVPEDVQSRRFVPNVLGDTSQTS